MLITDPAKRAARQAEKQQTLLRFLREETWSDAATLGAVAGLTTRQAAHKTLTAMAAAQMVRSAAITFAGRAAITLWGITPHGLALSWGDDDEPRDLPTFEPSRLAPSTVPHRLAMQQARLAATAAGLTDWVVCDRGEWRAAHPDTQTPDAVVTTPDGVIAVEVELTIKTIKRYREIVAGHLLAIKHGHWSAVHYLTPPELVKPMRAILRGVSWVLINGQRVELEERHTGRFSVHCLADWPGSEKKETSDEP